MLIKSKYSNDGFSMIEVLVSVVVIAVGLLGIASLQASAISNTTATSTESAAALETYSLVSRMRANREFWKVTLAPLNEQSLVIKRNADDVVSADGDVFGAAVKLLDCTTVMCTPPEMARFDLIEWYKGVEQHMAITGASVHVPTGYPKVLTISVDWDKRQSAFGLHTDNADVVKETYSVTVVM